MLNADSETMFAFVVCRGSVYAPPGILGINGVSECLKCIEAIAGYDNEPHSSKLSHADGLKCLVWF